MTNTHNIKRDKLTVPFEEIKFQKLDVPFKLGTTTFIYPADWIANARALGRAFDELELLLFESCHPESLPTATEIQTLAELAIDLNFTWNVHLPIDIHPGHTDLKLRQQAVDVIRRAIERTAPLAPTTHTLHLSGITGRSGAVVVNAWQERVHATIESIKKGGLPGNRLTIENIPDYPLELALPVIDAFGLEVCLDIGHLLVAGRSVRSAFEIFNDRITFIHLHGVADGRDHRDLANLPPEIQAFVAAFLKDFTGTVTLEVFSREHLLASLVFLQNEWSMLSTVPPNSLSLEP